ncbi:autotransporter domain-containing protein [Pseudomonas sp. SWRI196]|uniref:Autotransporter domain-containing protein n=2 Tax=Pseudomonas tehranensis TaxID=2745502 RepID=A0ABR6UXP2_9PSED|nr:autotransporter domain-containing protein [Pseudomonas tehranensis]
MSIQPLHPPQHLALAIALVLGCVDVSRAQPPADILTTAEQQEHLRAFAEAADTKRHNANIARRGGEKWTRKNDLVIISGKGRFPGIIDGGGGKNVLQLDAAKHPILAETRNFMALQVTQGEWQHTGSFTGWGVIEPDTTLLNTGQIEGQVGVLGKLDNQGMVANHVTVEPGASMTNSGVVNGQVYVREKARFSGNGTVDFLSIAGQLEVGPETGAPAVTKELSLAETAELIYGVNAEGGSSTINVEGTALLNNATLTVAGVPGEYIETREHTVIRAGKIEGALGTVSSKLAFMTATLTPTDTQVNLTYARNAVPIEEAANSENGREFATHIEERQPVKPPAPAPMDVPTVTQAAVTKPRIEAPAVKPAEPPDITPTAPAPATPLQTTKPAEKPNIALSALPNTHVNTVADAGKSKAVDPTSKPAEPRKIIHAAPKPTGQLQTTQPVAKPNAAINALLGSDMMTAASAIDQLSGYNTADLGNATLSSMAPISSAMLSAMGQKNPGSVHADGQVWVQTIGNSGSIGKQLGSYALKHSTSGVMLGTDWAISPDWRLGVIGSKTQTRLDSQQFDGRLDSWHLGAYALRQDGPWALRLGAVYANHDGSTKRHVVFNGFRDRLKGRYDAHTQQVFGQLGYNLNIGHFDVEPYIDLGYQRYRRDRYSEKGGDAALQFNGQTQDYFHSNLGLHLARSFSLDQGMRLTPRLSLGWKHLYGETRGASRQGLAGAGKSYTVEGDELDRDSLLFETGLDLAVSPRHTLGVSYKGETGQDNRNGALTGQWRMMF